MSSSGPSLAIIIVTYNSADVIDECVAALDRALGEVAWEKPDDVHLVVVDNASRFRPNIAEGPARRTTMIPLGENLGFSPAVNHGLAVAPEADLVLLLNPDARLGPTALRELLSEHERRRAAVSGPALVNPEDSPHGVSERPFHSIALELRRQFAPWTVHRKPWGPTAGETGEARCLTGACLLVDAAFLRNVGGLDTYVPMYLEDVELCWQAHEAGRAVVLVKRSRCGHALGGSSEGENFRVSKGLHLTLLAARVEFVRRRSGAATAVAMRAIIAIGAGLRVPVALGMRQRALAKKHAATAHWAVRSGGPPPWPPQ